MNTILYTIGSLLFLCSAAAHIYVRLRLRRSDKSDLEDYYYEFEDRCPEYARYCRYLDITLAGAAVAMLLLLVAVVI